MAKRPHILIFNPDQWRGDMLGHVGDPAAVTPNLDRAVATDTVSFRHAFCQNTVCTPSRCAFMTGWYPHVRGHRTMHHMLHPEWGEPNLLRMLRDNGYFVWWGGKNDLVPAQDGYEAYCDVKFRATEADFKRWGRSPRPGNHSGVDWRGAPDSDTFYSFYRGRLDPGEDNLYLDGDWCNVLGAIDFIREYQGDKPLCVYLPLGFPHPPYCVEDPWYSMIDRDKVKPRAPTPETWEGKPSLLKGIAERQRLQTWTEERWTELRATYQGMCARVDHQFGLVLDAFREAGIYEDAAVFFFADHGDFTGDYGLVEKSQNTFEDCLSRIPFLVKAPKDVPVAPRVSDALVELTDFSATVFDLTGIKPGYTSFGKSLLPLLADATTDEHRDAVFCEGGRIYGEEHCTERESKQEEGKLYWPRCGLQGIDYEPYHSKAVMCRTKEFKYTRRLYESDELYDLTKDPGELHNVVDDPAYAEVLAQLKDRMLTFFLETGDVVPFDTDRRG